MAYTVNVGDEKGVPFFDSLGHLFIETSTGIYEATVTGKNEIAFYKCGEDVVKMKKEADKVKFRTDLKPSRKQLQTEVVEHAEETVKEYHSLFPENKTFMEEEEDTVGDPYNGYFDMFETSFHFNSNGAEVLVCQTGDDPDEYSLYETLLYKDGKIAFKSTYSGMPSYRLVLHTNGEILLRPTGGKTFSSAVKDTLTA